MKKPTLSLDKELLTSAGGASTVDGGVAPIVDLYTVALLWLAVTSDEQLSVFSDTCTQVCASEPQITVEG